MNGGIIITISNFYITNCYFRLCSSHDAEDIHYTVTYPSLNPGQSTNQDTNQNYQTRTYKIFGLMP